MISGVYVSALSESKCDGLVLVWFATTCPVPHQGRKAAARLPGYLTRRISRIM